MNENINLTQVHELNIPQKYVDRVWMYNEERGLLDKGFDVDLEYQLLKEEYDGRGQAIKDNYMHECVFRTITSCVVFIGTCIKASLNNVNLQEVLPSYKVFASIVEDAFYDITKLGYEPKCAFNEVLLTIESRTGRIVDGKFSKWRPEDEEFTGNYEANFELCKLK